MLPSHSWLLGPTSRSRTSAATGRLNLQRTEVLICVASCCRLSNAARLTALRARFLSAGLTLPQDVKPVRELRSARLDAQRRACGTLRHDAANCARGGPQRCPQLNRDLFTADRGDRRAMARKIVASLVEARHHGVPDVVVGVEVDVRSLPRVDPVKIHQTGPDAFSRVRWRVFNDTGFLLLYHGVRPTVRLLSRHAAAQYILEHPTDGLEIDLHLPTPPVSTVAIKLIVSHDPILPLGANLPNIPHPIQGLMPTARASRHG